MTIPTPAETEAVTRAWEALQSALVTLAGVPWPPPQPLALQATMARMTIPRLTPPSEQAVIRACWAMGNILHYIYSPLYHPPEEGYLEARAVEVLAAVDQSRQPDIYPPYPY